MKHKDPNVLVILPLAFQEGLDKYAGIMRFLRDAGRTWNIRLDRMTRSTDNRPNYRLEDFDGIIADDPTSEQDGNSLLRSTLPLVALDWRNRTALSHRRKTVSISSDPKAIGRKAAETFLDIGQYASYAYLSPGLPSSWSAERLDAFLKRLVRKGFTATLLDPGPALGKQLLRLQKPAAVFAANDIAAADLLDLAKGLQVSVPLDVSVIGVDNEQITCTNTVPPLASIQPDFEKGGYLAANSLQALFDGKSPAKSRHYPIKGVVRRKSLGIPRETDGLPNGHASSLTTHPSLICLGFPTLPISLGSRAAHLTSAFGKSSAAAYWTSSKGVGFRECNTCSGIPVFPSRRSAPNASRPATPIRCVSSSAKSA